MKFKLCSTRDLGENIDKRLDENAIWDQHIEHWTIEIDSIEELMAFTRRNVGRVVIETEEDGMPMLEIYNDYRE